MRNNKNRKKAYKFKKLSNESWLFKTVNRFGGPGIITKVGGVLALFVIIIMLGIMIKAIMHVPALLFVPILLGIAFWIFFYGMVKGKYDEAADTGESYRQAEVGTYGDAKKSTMEEIAAYYNIRSDHNVTSFIVGRQKNKIEDELLEEVEHLTIDSNLHEERAADNEALLKEISAELREAHKETKLLCIPSDGTPKELPNENIMIIGGSGSGKTFMSLIPNAIISGRRGESVVFTDPSGQLYNLLSEYYRHNGYDVKIFNTVNLQNSDSWDFIQELAYGTDDDVKDKANLATSIILSAISEDSVKKASFWDDSNYNLLKGLLLYVAKSSLYKGPRNYLGLLDVLTNQVQKSIPGDRGERVYEFDIIVNRMPAEDLAKEPLMNFVQSSQNARDGVPSGLYVKLSRLDARHILSYPEIDTLSLGKKKTALFLMSSDQNSTYDGLVTLITSFLFTNLSNLAQEQANTRLPNTVRFYLDEFPNIGQIPDFQKKIATTRKYGMPITIILQGLPQIQAIYKDSWEAIFANCSLTLFLGGAAQDQTTLKHVSAMTGETTAIQTTARYSSHAFDFLASDATPQVSKGEAKRNVYMPSDLAALNKSRMLVFATTMGNRVTECSKAPAYCLHEWEYCEHHLSNPQNHIPDWNRKKGDDKEQIFIAEGAAPPVSDDEYKPRYRSDDDDIQDELREEIESYGKPASSYGSGRLKHNSDEDEDEEDRFTNPSYQEGVFDDGDY